MLLTVTSSLVAAFAGFLAIGPVVVGFAQGGAAGVVVDRLGFPVYAKATLRAMRGTGAIYTTSDTFDAVTAWYRQRARADWAISRSTWSSVTGEREQDFHFPYASGLHTIVVTKGNAERLVVITEFVRTKQAMAADRAAAERAAHPPGGIDALGIPVYPNVIPGRGFTKLPGLQGGASYATRDDLSTVVAWYRSRLVPLGFEAAGGAPMQTQADTAAFTRGSDSVTIVRGRPGGVTLILEQVRSRR